VTRAFAVVFGLIAAVAASYAAFGLMRAVGPEDRSGEFGFKSAPATKESNGNLLQTRDFERVLAALRRELGAHGGVQSLSLESGGASVLAQVDGRQRYVDVDASGRSRSRDGDRAQPAALVPVAKIDARALDRISRAAEKESSVPVERVILQGAQREWLVFMRNGEPDQFVANLDGRGLRLPGEPNPDPVGAGPDSMLRHKNLARVLDAASQEGSRITSLDVRPDRVSVTVLKGKRAVALSYGYDAQLTGRDIQPNTSQNSVPLSAVNPRAPERMARHRQVKGLDHVNYVLLSPLGGLLLYITPAHDPPYIAADFDGHHITWPGKT
jgi:hypothetical protein